LQFLRGDTENVISGVGQQQQVVGNIMQQIQSYVPKVQQAWTGQDADKFAEDVATILIPAIMALIAAIAGVNTNLNQATSFVDQADQQCTSMVGQLGDLFGGI
jgi:uncharacterized protein YukE